MKIKGEDIFHLFQREVTIDYIRNISETGFDTYDDATDELFAIVEEDLEGAEDSLKQAQEELEEHLAANPDDKGSGDVQEGYLYEPYIEIWAKSEQLSSLAEMKVIYLFKNLETALKSVIKQAYPDINVKEYYRSDNLAATVAALGITIKDIKGYTEYNQLRIVNNGIKHSSEITGEIKNITEFKNDEQFYSASIIKFYNRVKSKVISFSKGFAEEIIKSAFTYSDDRLVQISKSYLDKMDQQTANRFSEVFARELNERYTIRPKKSEPIQK